MHPTVLPGAMKNIRSFLTQPGGGVPDGMATEAAISACFAERRTPVPPAVGAGGKGGPQF